MSWICPWCGKENEQDERIGRRDPRCTLCNEVRCTPEELEERRDESISDLEEKIEKISEKAQCIRERKSSLEDQISDLREKIDDCNEELSDLRAEAGPLQSALCDWKHQIVHYEARPLWVFAQEDKYQTKLPFEEVPA